jgi:DNA invertase Pin-like site-specific DNA recombinase
MHTIPVTYGYARVSKADDDSKNLETQLRELRTYGIRDELILADVGSGQTMDRPKWNELMGLVRSGDTIVTLFLDRVGRTFNEEVAILADFTGRDIGVISIRDQVDSRDAQASQRFFQRVLLANAAYQRESTSERIRMGLDRARATGKRIGRPPALTPEQVEECRRMAEGGASVRHIARVLQKSPATVRKALQS